MKEKQDGVDTTTTPVAVSNNSIAEKTQGGEYAPGSLLAKLMQGTSVPTTPEPGHIGFLAHR